MISDYEKNKNKIEDKMNDLKDILEDETLPKWKRNQAYTKHKEMERKYYKDVVHSGGTLKKYNDRKQERKNK